MDPALIAFYPNWETLPHERLSPRSDTVGKRLAVLRRLKHPGADPGTGPLRVVVAPVRALLQPQVAGLGDLTPVELETGQTMPLEEVVERLAAAAYVRVDLVERRGEYAVRGGLVDVFPPTEEHPLRLEFWGDEVEEIRSFAVADQRTLEKVGSGLGAAVPRTAADRRGPPPRGRTRPPSPHLGRDDREVGPGHRRRGDGGAGARPGRRDGDVRRSLSRRRPGAGARSRAGEDARTRSGRDQRRVPRGQLGRGGRGWDSPDRPRRRVVPTDRRRPRRGPRSGPDLVDAQSIRNRRSRQRHRPGADSRSGVSRRHRGGRRRYQVVVRPGLSDSCDPPRLRPGPTDGRSARGARPPCPAPRNRSGSHRRDDRDAGARFRRPGQSTGVAHR